MKVQLHLVASYETWVKNQLLVVTARNVYLMRAMIAVRKLKDLPSAAAPVFKGGLLP